MTRQVPGAAKEGAKDRDAALRPALRPGPRDLLKGGEGPGAAVGDPPSATPLPLLALPYHLWGPNRPSTSWGPGMGGSTPARSPRWLSGAKTALPGPETRTTDAHCSIRVPLQSHFRYCSGAFAGPVASLGVPGGPEINGTGPGGGRGGLGPTNLRRPGPEPPSRPQLGEGRWWPRRGGGPAANVQSRDWRLRTGGTAPFSFEVTCSALPVPPPPPRRHRSRCPSLLGLLLSSLDRPSLPSSSALHPPESPYTLPACLFPLSPPRSEGTGS